MNVALVVLLIGLCVLLVPGVAFVRGCMRQSSRTRHVPAAPTCPVCERAPVDAAWAPTCSRQCWRWKAWVQKHNANRGGPARSAWDA